MSGRANLARGPADRPGYCVRLGTNACSQTATQQCGQRCSIAAHQLPLIQFLEFNTISIRNFFHSMVDFFF